jgi:hypothetical protein
MRAAALSALTEVPFVGVHQVVCERTGVHRVDRKRFAENCGPSIFEPSLTAL